VIDTDSSKSVVFVDKAARWNDRRVERVAVSRILFSIRCACDLGRIGVCIFAGKRQGYRMARMPEMGIETRIKAIGGESADLGSLYDWLRNEDGLRGCVRFARAPFGAEEMGAAQDAIVVAAGSGGALTVLASALPVWLRQRRGSQVKIEITVPALGVRLLVETDRAHDAERALQQLLDACTEGR
jgi:hypothetical protein